MEEHNFFLKKEHLQRKETRKLRVRTSVRIDVSIDDN